MARRVFKNLKDIPARCLPNNLSDALHLSHPARAEPCRTKYGNTKTFAHGQLFDSKREARRYEELMLLKAAGEIRSVIRQVSLPLLSGKNRMRIDFVIVENDGRIRWEDAKGYATPEWLVKRNEVEAAYGIRIETV